MLTQLLLPVVGAVFGWLALWHEWRWRKRMRNWQVTKGTIVDVDESPSSDVPHPVIEYRRGGTMHRFVSEYGESGAGLLVGRTVKVYYDPGSARAEYRSATTRWVFTVVPGVFCAGCSCLVFFAVEPEKGADRKSVPPAQRD